MSYIKQAEKDNVANQIAELKFTLTGSPLLAKIMEREKRGKHRENENVSSVPNKKLSQRSYIIIDKGPDANHKCVLLILEGKLVNYGIIETEITSGDVKAIISNLSKAKNPDNSDLVTHYLSSNKVEKLEFIKP